MSVGGLLIVNVRPLCLSIYNLYLFGCRFLANNVGHGRGVLDGLYIARYVFFPYAHIHAVLALLAPLCLCSIQGQNPLWSINRSC